MKTDKVIFLDIDGVLNSHDFIDKKPDYRIKDLDPKSISCLNSILDRTDARIVVSSTWRLAYPSEELVSILEGQGLAKNKVIGKTPHLNFYRGIKGLRGLEISAWIDCLLIKPKSILIIDDENDFDSVFEPVFLQTPMKTGLTILHVERAVQILNSALFSSRSFIRAKPGCSIS